MDHLITGRAGHGPWFEIDNRDRRPPHRRRCRNPAASHLGGASVRSSQRRRYDGRNGIDTCSSKDQYPFRINLDPRADGVFRAHHQRDTPPPLPSRTREARYTVRLRRTGWESYCAELVLTAINPPPPFSPLLRFASQAGRQPLLHTLQATAHAVGCRLVWLHCGRSATPPSITQSPLTRGKKKKKEEGSTRNVREGSMAKWGCHVVDSKPRSAVSLFLFPFSSACQNTLF